MHETWLPIEGCDGRYSISSYGRVLSHARTIPRSTSGVTKIRERVLKPSVGKSHGYVVVNLLRYGTQAPRLIHRLVAEAFLGACPEGYECAHKDGDRTNPRLENLRWATHTENNGDKVLHKTQIMGEQVNLARLTAEQVSKIKKDGRTQTAIAKSYGVHQSTISYIRSGLTWKHI